MNIFPHLVGEGSFTKGADTFSIFCRKKDKVGNYEGVLSCFNDSVVIWTGHKSSFVRLPGVTARWLISYYGIGSMQPAGCVAGFLYWSRRKA